MNESYKIFKEKKFLIFQELKKNLLDKIKEAKNPHEALNEYKLLVIDPSFKEMEQKLGRLTNFMKEANSFLEKNNTMKLAEAFDLCYNSLHLAEKKKIQQYLAKYEAWIDLKKLWNHKYFSAIGKKEKKALQYKANKEKTKLVWKDRNPNDFVLLIHALYEAGYISNKEDDIKSIMPSLAKLLNFSLNKNWQSQLAKTIKIKTLDYRPEIFDKIETAFSQYIFRMKKGPIVEEVEA